MEDEPSFLWEASPDDVNKESTSSEADFHSDMEDFFKDLHGISVEELEVDLRRKEKELYLCSRLGLFLAQEVDELLNQRRGIISDHTKLLIEMQEYKNTRRSFLDISDGASVVSQNLKDSMTNGGGEPAGLQDADNTLTPSGSKLPSAALERTCSIESLDMVSNAESVMTSVSSVRELQQDLDVVQKSHDRISKIEAQLDNTRAKYRSLMTHYAHKLKELSRELGTCVAKARPYFEAVRKAKKCQIETQQAAMEFKRAVNVQKGARDMVKVAEERVMAAEDKLDPTWQEMLNKANIKVNEASQEKHRIHRLHLNAAKQFQIAEEKKLELQQKLQRNIAKSQPYFDVQKEFKDKLEAITKRLNMLELKLLEARQAYSFNLSRLKRTSGSDKASDALQSLSERGAGVGAENPHLLLDSSSALPKPALDFLEKQTAELENDRVAKTSDQEMTSDVSTPVRTKLKYNPYDLLYLTDLGSESPSDVDTDSGDEYLQDF